MSLVSGPGRAGSSALPDELQLAIEPHIKYIQSLDTVCLLRSVGFTLLTNLQRRDELEYHLTEHLRLNGVYWGLNALHLLGKADGLPREATIEFVLSCQDPETGGFGAAPGHDAHLLYTVSAVQILCLVDGVEELESRGRKGGKMAVGECMSHLPQLQARLMKMWNRHSQLPEPQNWHICW